MNSKRLFMTLMAMAIFYCSFGQTKEELTAEKAEKAAKAAELKSQLDGLTGEIAGIDAKLLEWPRWEAGAFGTVGLGFNGFSNWQSRNQPNIASSTIGVALNGYANNLAKKYFWRNAANINMGWVKFDDKDNPDDEPGFQQSADVINISSLFGYKLSEKLAASALAEYRSTILTNFNNPGYLDIGVGATWTPVANLVVVVHPLNYNFVFASDTFNYESSLGAKIVADYTKELVKGVNWKSNLSIFQSYKSSDLSNWTWVNSFGFQVFKGIGVGLELGLRNNKQESLAAGLTDNPLQSYYVLGLSYGLSAKK
jgi:hypothetical protein